MANPSQSYGPSSDEPGSEGSGAGLREKPLTWTLLAGKLGVSVQAVFAWRKRADAPDVPNFDRWVEYMAKHGLGGGAKGASALKDEKTRHEIEILKARLAREKRTVIPAEEVQALLLHLSTQSRTVLYQFMETEAPPKLDGMSAAQMRPILREMADAICEKMGDLITDFETR